MSGAEQALLLLTSHLGNPNRKPLTLHRLHKLELMLLAQERGELEQELTVSYLQSRGILPELAEQVTSLLSEEIMLRRYLCAGENAACYPLTRISQKYPTVLRNRLGKNAPGCLWYRGNLSLLAQPMAALVGSRDLKPDNLRFSEEVGRSFAKQGITLISGNARGSDRIAQDACLKAGGNIVCIVADSLWDKELSGDILYISEQDYDAPFSNYRALNRNHLIHALGDFVLVSQCSEGQGGTWSGTAMNLKNRLTPIYGFQDGSKAMKALEGLGAQLISISELTNLRNLAFREQQSSLWDCEDEKL